jgi:ABC-type transport system substrate-binding protein
MLLVVLAASAAETPKRGGILRAGYVSEFKSMDPAKGFDGDAIPYIKLLFRGLIDYDDGTGLAPDQAEDWSISPDGKTYTFHLKPGIRFANGREVEAADYVYSLERILNPDTGSIGQTYYLDILGAREFIDGKEKHVRGLSAPDKRTLVIELKAPTYTFRYVMAMAFATPVPREVVEKYGAEFQSHLSGTGPYRLAEWRKGMRWRFERNPYYTGTDGYFDGVDIMIGGDEALFTMMLQRGELDRVSASPAQAILFRRDPKLRSWLLPIDTANTDYLFMNVEMKPFDDARVRQAINYAINKERLLRVTGGFAVVAHGVVPPSIPWTNTTLPQYEYNPEKARALLAEAGYPKGFRIPLWFGLDARVFKPMAEAIQQDLQAIGVQVELRSANYNAFQVKAETRHQVEFGIWGWMLDYPDPSDFLDVLLSGERITETDCNNAAFYNSSEVNRLLAQAAGTVELPERTRLFRLAENKVLEDAPWVPLIHEQIPVLYHPRLHGTQPHPVWLWRYEKMWLE